MFRYAIATGWGERDRTADLRGALKPVLVRHMPAITDPKRVDELLRAIGSYERMPITRAVLPLAPLVFDRPGEICNAEWVGFLSRQAGRSCATCIRCQGMGAICSRVCTRANDR